VYVLAAVYETGPGADSSGTATWPDFLAVLEPNLNILCISLPMLASLMKLAVGKTTNASSNGEYQRSRTRTFGRGSAADKFRRMGDDSIRMDSMVTKTECRADARSDSGSETALSPAGDQGGGGNQDTLTDGIRVKRTLQVSVSEAQ
jgi:hypothetical protein